MTPYTEMLGYGSTGIYTHFGIELDIKLRNLNATGS